MKEKKGRGKMKNHDHYFVVGGSTGSSCSLTSESTQALLVQIWKVFTLTKI